MPDLFVGKTIKRIEKKGCNFWVFHFDDGSKTSIEVEATGVPNLYGMTAHKEKE